MVAEFSLQDAEVKFHERIPFVDGQTVLVRSWSGCFNSSAQGTCVDG